ncbi:hypothetical protein [Streptomyces sp. NPDC050121]|uniref:hypothetical protein n=1 Tax=Streptomyces sp. NPDC050121 TaxID=3365601 RepID=UPI0037A2BA43
MDATADNDYATCPRCKWAGKLRKNGTMRKHRESVDMGRFTMSGGLPQQPHGDICEGSGEKPWEPGLPEGYELPKQNEHGGWERGEAKPNDAKDVPQTSVPVFCGACGETFTARAALDAHQLETGHEMDQPDHPLKEDPGPSLDDYAKASRIIQSLIPGVRR